MLSHHVAIVQQYFQFLSDPLCQSLNVLTRWFPVSKIKSIYFFFAEASIPTFSFFGRATTDTLCSERKSARLTFGNLFHFRELFSFSVTLISFKEKNYQGLEYCLLGSIIERKKIQGPKRTIACSGTLFAEKNINRSERFPIPKKIDLGFVSLLGY